MEKFSATIDFKPLNCECRDGERWRYWRKHHGWTGYFDDGLTNNDTEDAVDKACDAAIDAEGQS